MVLRTAFDQARCEALESFSSVVSVFSLLLRVEKLACLITNVARPRTCATTPFSPSALRPRPGEIYRTCLVAANGRSAFIRIHLRLNIPWHFRTHTLPKS